MLAENWASASVLPPGWSATAQRKPLIPCSKKVQRCSSRLLVYAQRGAERGRAVATGAKKFGQSVWGPFVHAGGVLWLEVTGLFFALFGLFFAQNAYKLRHAWYSGADHPRFLIYVIVTLVFFYFTFSSFYRARKKEKLKRQRS